MLVPLELDLIARPGVASWTPGTWVETVTAAPPGQWTVAVPVGPSHPDDDAGRALDDPHQWPAMHRRIVRLEDCHMGLMFRRRRPLARLAVAAASYARIEGLPGRLPRYVAPPPASTGGEIDELSRLVHMRDSGDLSDAEFAAAKSQLLGT